VVSTGETAALCSGLCTEGKGTLAEKRARFVHRKEKRPTITSDPVRDGVKERTFRCCTKEPGKEGNGLLLAPGKKEGTSGAEQRSKTQSLLNLCREGALFQKGKRRRRLSLVVFL